MVTFDTVPLPRERVRNRQPINLELRGLDVWPQNRFNIRMDWNNHMGRWIIRIRHLGTDTLVTHSVASLNRPYQFEPHVEFIFYNTSDTTDKVSPTELGRNTKLAVLPIENEDGLGSV